MDCDSFVAELDGAVRRRPSRRRPPRRPSVRRGRRRRARLLHSGRAGCAQPCHSPCCPAGEAYLEVGTFKGRSSAPSALDAHGSAATSRWRTSRSSGCWPSRPGTSCRPCAGHAPAPVHPARRRLFPVLARLGCCPPRSASTSTTAGTPGSPTTWRSVWPSRGSPTRRWCWSMTRSWPLVAAATRCYIRRHPGWTVLRDIRAEADHDQRWANGLMVLSYRRPPGRGPQRWARRRPRALRWFSSRLRPADSLAWRAFTGSPGWCRWRSGSSRPGPGPSRRPGPGDPARQPRLGRVEDQVG